ncbi:MAG TPA: YciI family protein, partial [Gemmataceae bacterium]|nr:YciI family protein [Gemmataceae bacterium]
PPVTKGTVEIRPLRDLDGLPSARPHSVEPGTTPYLLQLFHEKSRPEVTDPAEQQAAAAKAVALARELDEAGAYVSAAPLHPAETATSVRIRDGKRLVTDGPFAETNEVLGGYYLIRAESRDAALRVAERLPGVGCCSTVELRPLFDLSGVREIVAANPRPAVDSAAVRSTIA